MKELLGSYNSASYLKPKCWFKELTRKRWRTQSKNIFQQICSGVQALDFHVRLDDKIEWRMCSINTDFDVGTMNTLFFSECCNMQSYVRSLELHSDKPLFYRVVLESGTIEDAEIFIDEIEKMTSDAKLVAASLRCDKSNKGKWTDIYVNDKYSVKWIKNI